MPRPGTEILIADGAGPAGLALDTGQAFMIGVAERGPVGESVRVTSARAYERVFGARSGGSLLSDSVSAFFGEGGAVAHVARISGSGALPATIVYGTGGTAKAASPGTWGNGVTLETAAPTSLVGETFGAGDRVLIVKYGGAEVERSPVVSDGASAAAWSASSDWVRITAPTALPAAGTTVTLTGGTNVNTVDATTVAEALGTFDYALGPGQVLAPGLTTTAVHGAVLAHVDAMRRCALLDAPDSPSPSSYSACVKALYPLPGVRFASLWGPWAVYPGAVAPATVTVPYSAVEAGIIARVDRAGNPNAPAAGVDGIARLALGLSQTFNDDEREALNALGVDLAKPVYGDIRSYGYRTAAGDGEPNWLWFSNSRTVMAIAYECDAIAENYVLQQIDGRGHLFGRLNKDLRGVCSRFFFMDALYGETPEEAFTVDTGPGANTPESIANGEVHAVVKVRTSPAAEWVVIEIVKVPIDRALAA